MSGAAKTVRKMKIYLDTSAISHMEQPEKPSEQAYSLAMFERIKAGEFSVCLSSVVFDEINECTPTRKEALLRHISEVRFDDVGIDEAVKTLAAKIIERRVFYSDNHDR